MKLKALVKQNRYELLIFFALIFRAAFTVDWKDPVKYVYLPLYLADFRVGVASRLFIGSIVSLLTRRVTERWLVGFLLVSLALAYLLTAAVLGRLLKKAAPSSGNAAVLLTVLFVFCSFTVRPFALFLGELDLFLYIFALLAAVCAPYRRAAWFIPLLIVFSVAAIYSAAFSFIPFILAIVFYELVKSGFSGSRTALVVVSVVAFTAATVYFVFFANRFLFMDRAEMNAFIAGRTDIDYWKTFLDGYLFMYDEESGLSADSVWSMTKIITSFNKDAPLWDYAGYAVFLVPVFGAFALFWRRASREAGSRAERYFLRFCLLLPLACVPALIISTDFERFISEALTAQFGLVFYLLRARNKAVEAVLAKAEAYMKARPMALAALVIFCLSPGVRKW